MEQAISIGRTVGEIAIKFEIKSKRIVGRIARQRAIKAGLTGEAVNITIRTAKSVHTGGRHRNR